MTMIGLTLVGIFRDRIFRGILMASLVFLAIPLLSTLSMRQVTELSLTLCLSLVSFVLLLLSIFLGSVSIWKDMERRYTHSVITLPMSRTQYLLGRFAGVALFLLGTAGLLGIVAALTVSGVSYFYPPERPILWPAVIAAIGMDSLKCIMLVAFSLLFASVSTTVFLPIFGTIAIFLVGGATQQAYDYVHSAAGHTLDPLVKQTASFLYYLLPNFSAFDFKVNAIYALAIDYKGLALTLGYFLTYTTIVLLCATSIFNRRELG